MATEQAFHLFFYIAAGMCGLNVARFAFLKLITESNARADKQILSEATTNTDDEERADDAVADE